MSAAGAVPKENRAKDLKFATKQETVSIRCVFQSLMKLCQYSGDKAAYYFQCNILS